MEYDRVAPQRQLYSCAQVSSFALRVFGDIGNFAFHVLIHDNQAVPQRIADVSDSVAFVFVDRIAVFVNVIADDSQHDDERIWSFQGIRSFGIFAKRKNIQGVWQHSVGNVFGVFANGIVDSFSIQGRKLSIGNVFILVLLVDCHLYRSVGLRSIF